MSILARWNSKLRLFEAFENYVNSNFAKAKPD